MVEVLRTNRLSCRELTEADFTPLCAILQDPEVMYAYEHAFCLDEVNQWLAKQLERYKQYGFGLWAVVLRESGEMIGQCGLTMQESPFGQVLEIGYLFNKKHWHKGYAIEAAAACKDYAFYQLGYDQVYSIIRENNLPSVKVAQKNGMTLKGKFDKFYYGVTMPHLVYSVKKPII